jgi:REP element-mobilizing transposase RayT
VHKGYVPVLVTLRAVRGLPSFRRELVLRLVKNLLAAQERRVRGTFRIPHFSIQNDHLHLIAESDDGSVTSGVRGFIISFARQLNRLLGRDGRVWGDRYHRSDLTNPRQTRNALAYVLNNDLKHGVRAADPLPGIAMIDIFSSGPLFEGWCTKTISVRYAVPWADMRPRTWMLAEGWRRAWGDSSVRAPAMDMVGCSCERR